MFVIVHLVNVDSQARTTAQDNLHKAESDLFMQVCQPQLTVDQKNFNINFF